MGPGTGQGEPVQAEVWPRRGCRGGLPQGSWKRDLSRAEGAAARHHLPHQRPAHLQTRGRQSKARSRNHTYVGLINRLTDRPSPTDPPQGATPTQQLQQLRFAFLPLTYFMFSDSGVKILQSAVRADMTLLFHTSVTGQTDSQVLPVLSRSF